MPRSIFKTLVLTREKEKTIEIDLFHPDNRYKIIYLVEASTAQDNWGKYSYQLNHSIKREGRKLIITLIVPSRYRLAYRILPPLFRWRIRKE